MPAPPTTTRSISLLPIVVGALVVIGLVLAVLYLNRPAPQPQDSQASPEAKAYLSHLDLSEVTMKASESFMNQQIVEIEGNIGNQGPRPLRSISVYCLFYGVDGHEIHRERVPVVSPAASPLKPGETRHFRLPFDNLPSGWNQTIPKMVIAQITFVS